MNRRLSEREAAPYTESISNDRQACAQQQCAQQQWPPPQQLEAAAIVD